MKELPNAAPQIPDLGKPAGCGVDTGDPIPLDGDPLVELVLGLEQVAVPGGRDHHGVREVDRGRENEPRKIFARHLMPCFPGHVSSAKVPLTPDYLLAIRRGRMAEFYEIVHARV